MSLIYPSLFLLKNSCLQRSIDYDQTYTVNVLSWDARYNWDNNKSFICTSPFDPKSESGWLSRAMVLGSFQCRGVLLIWHMVGQGPVVLATDAMI